MAEKRGKRRLPDRRGSEREVVVVEDPASDRLIPEPQLARLRLRQRWELASVLHFLHVFEPLIQSKLQISAEEIETALISPNDSLAQLHIALLKGIPPVNNKNLTEPNAWVKVICKKLAVWWPWVAEGENPLIANHGEEILRYKDLDSTTRLLILKAVCEIRADQDDILSYITDALKTGTKVDTFRKEKIGGDGHGITYWYDGDPIIGHRLYKEVIKVDFKHKLKGKGNFAQAAINSQWETMATSLEEFREIAENLSSSKITQEAAVGETIKLSIVPLLEELQKKKERALKRQQRQAMMLDNFLDSNRSGIRQSRRERKPVSYTFDEYDRSINEAIQISKKLKSTEFHKDDGKQVKHVPDKNESASNSVLHLDKEDSGREIKVNVDGYRGKKSDDENRDKDSNDDEKDDYVDSSDNDGDYVHTSDTDEEKSAKLGQTRSEPAQKDKDSEPKVALGLRRSRRTAGNKQGDSSAYLGEVAGHAGMKKRLGQRPTPNAEYTFEIVSDSEDDNSDDDKKNEEVSDTEKEPSDSSDCP